MASFQKRGKTWQYTVSAKPKPIRKGGFKTKKEAQIAAAEVEDRLNKGRAPVARRILFADYFESWYKTFKKDVVDNTLKAYEITHDHIVEDFEGVYTLDIDKRRYQRFLNSFGKTHAKMTTKKVNSHIRACVKDGIDEGVFVIDFTRGAVLVGNKGKPNIDKYLDYKDSEKLLKAILERLDRTPTYYLLLLALTTGMRFGEIVGLTRNDFDFENNMINIDKTWGYTKRMNRGFTETKNEESIRKITVDPETMTIFKKWFESIPDNIKRLVFYSPTSKYHVISNAVANKVLSNLIDRLKIKKITLHGLRHTYASIQLYKGVSVYSVSEHLGHADIATTMSVYTHIVKELRAKDQKLMAESFTDMYKASV